MPPDDPPIIPECEASAPFDVGAISCPCWPSIGEDMSVGELGIMFGDPAAPVPVCWRTVWPPVDCLSDVRDPRGRSSPRLDRSPPRCVVVRSRDRSICVLGVIASAGYAGAVASGGCCASGFALSSVGEFNTQPPKISVHIPKAACMFTLPSHWPSRKGTSPLSTPCP